MLSVPKTFFLSFYEPTYSVKYTVKTHCEFVVAVLLVRSHQSMGDWMGKRGFDVHVNISTLRVRVQDWYEKFSGE